MPNPDAGLASYMFVKPKQTTNKKKDNNVF